MREIKFRAWDKVNKKMICCKNVGFFGANNPMIFAFPGDYTWINGSTSLVNYIVPTEHRSDFVYMQYTGLKDKNGNEIYEGDIVRYKEKNIEVQWLQPTNQGGYYFPFDPTLESHFSYEFEVIGKIYENPELLTNSLDEITEIAQKNGMYDINNSDCLYDNLPDDNGKPLAMGLSCPCPKHSAR